MNTTEIRCAIELRAAVDTPGRIVGTLIETGRVASDRRELFIPGAVQWPGGGVRLLAEHRGREVMRFEPKIDGAKIQIDTPLPDTAIGREIAAEIRAGRKRGLSVEFYASSEGQVQGVREVRSALIEAVAVVESPAYVQAVAEVRSKRGRRVWL